MAGHTDWLVVLIPLVLSGIAAGWWRLVYRPVRSDVDEALERSRKARQEVAKLNQLLAGAETDADPGVLSRLDEELSAMNEELAEIRSQIQRRARLDTERTEQVQSIVQSLDNIDGVDVETRPDGYIIHSDEDFLRGSDAESESEPDTP